MKMLPILLLLLVSGCQHWDAAIPQQMLSEAGAGSCLPKAAAAASPSDWLIARPCVCEAGQSSNDAVAFDPEHASRQVVYLLQSSCNLERLGDFDIKNLKSMSHDDAWDGQQRQLIELIFDHAILVRELQAEVDAIDSKLKSTIEGIHNIESDMNDPDLNGTEK